MDNLIYILFICIVAPILLMLLILQKRSRLLIFYMLVGICSSLFISELNTILLQKLDLDLLYFTTTVTPITEEIIKALPVLFYAYLFSDDRDKVMPIAFATGIGFAMFENIVILLQNIQNVTIGWAVIRGFSTALMHGVCTLAVGFGICYVRKKKKLFVSGTFALLATAISYHGIFNMLVQSDYRYFGFIVPAVTYIPLVIVQYLSYIKKTKERAAQRKKQGNACPP